VVEKEKTVNSARKSQSAKAEDSDYSLRVESERKRGQREELREERGESVSKEGQSVKKGGGVELRLVSRIQRAKRKSRERVKRMR